MKKTPFSALTFTKLPSTRSHRGPLLTFLPFCKFVQLVQVRSVPFLSRRIKLPSESTMNKLMFESARAPLMGLVWQCAIIKVNTWLDFCFKLCCLTYAVSGLRCKLQPDWFYTFSLTWNCIYFAHQMQAKHNSWLNYFTRYRLPSSDRAITEGRADNTFFFFFFIRSYWKDLYHLVFYDGTFNFHQQSQVFFGLALALASRPAAT